MAATFTITETRDQAMTFDGSGDDIKITWNRDYHVQVSGVPNPATLDAFTVCRAAGLPKVNRSVYVTSADQIIPWVICRTKTAKQDPKRTDRWKVSTKWDTGKRSDNNESDNDPIDKPANLTDITPRVESELGEFEEVLYQDKSPSAVNILTPTGNYWAEPAFERIPTLILRISQYEASITYEQMLDRRFKNNEKQYRNKGRYTWFIEDLEAHEVDIELASGPTTAVLATYTVVYTLAAYGWRDVRALVDTHYYNASGEKIPFADDEQRTATIGFVKADGTDNSSATTPDYVDYETQPTIDFDTFLQV